jgi:deoxyribodipyrimidine photo-lyase
VSTTPTSLPRSLLWFRQDLRLADNPALHSALKRGAVIPVYIESFAEEGTWAPGAASRWWLHESLRALSASLAQLGAPLILRRGPALPTLRALLRESGADAVYWNRRYEPAVLARDRIVKETLRAAGFLAESANGALLAEPWEIRTQGGTPFQVFTPFMRQLLKQYSPPALLPAPQRWRGIERWPQSLTLDGLELLPRIGWYQGLSESWQAGEAAALQRLQIFTDTALGRYATQRDRPDLASTSRLSPHLHFGELSPRQIWHALPEAERHGGKFLSEVIWREFAHHLLFHFPHTPEQPLRSEFERFEWRADPVALKAWQQGRTGIPLVDAGMRELWHTGWMHNRVRMVVASFLVKNLRLPWQSGARWFWDTLVDADLANNTLGWQWTAGCGADASPWFRIFNPLTQAEKFDPEGHYVQRWAATGSALEPIVDLKASREAALDAYAKMRGK